MLCYYPEPDIIEKLKQNNTNVVDTQAQSKSKKGT